MTPELNRIYQGDCLEIMRTWPAGFVQTCVTSPPYWGLRDYGVAGQLGLEKTPQEYVVRMVEVFRYVRRVMRDDGTLWLNLGDSYNSRPGGPQGESGDRSDRTPQGAGKFRPGAGRADGKIDDRGQRNRDGVSDPSLKPKDLIGIPWRVAFALQADGWYLRQDIIWSKPNPMPESVTDRCTKAHEYIFLLAKSERYFYDAEAIKEKADPASDARYKHDFSGAPEGAVICPGDSKGQRTRPEGKREFNGMRNKRSVWTVSTKPYSESHFATFPPDLIAPCVLAGSAPGGLVLDLFMGAGTTALVAAKYDRKFIGCELNPDYIKMAERRIAHEIAQIKML